MVGDLFSIPLQDEIADEVWLLNVFGSSVEDEPITLPNGALWHTLGFSLYFTELARILKPNANLIIGEWYPPREKKVDWLMESDYKSFGLSRHVYTERAFEQFASDYGIRFVLPISVSVTTPFFIVLTKTAPLPTSQVLRTQPARFIR